MSELMPADFAPFFRELWQKDPFCWQEQLAQRVCQGRWPEIIALPTAAGKTACIDIALFALAAQAHWPAEKRTAPRRVFFVVDRRVIVEEAYQRASCLQRILAGPTAARPTVRRVARCLRALGGRPAPLQVYQLRGGIARDETWVHSPLQVAVVTSTVDQVGSRLLFRGYGVSEATRSIHAALIGHDSLLLLDEAHCARPFSQTLAAVQRYRGADWATRPLETPFALVQMTATPPPDCERGAHEPVVFRLPEEDLQPDRLGRRIGASKPTVLIEAKKAANEGGTAVFARQLAKEAVKLAQGGAQTIAVVVNRVATAKEVEKRLHEAARTLPQATVTLVVGRMRPIDRDALGALLRLRVGSGADRSALAGPVFVVATQCLEVGADYDFDALVTECASLDALRQRFGRLNRLGRPIEAPARIFIRPDDVKRKENDPDPIYGMAAVETWKWLQEEKISDVGVAALDRKIDELRTTDPGRFARLHAAQADAPVLLPAHLDGWCQTSPAPMPDPDVAVFLHGPKQADPEVQVVWRADLPEAADAMRQEDLWTKTVSLCPPTTAECMPVPISVFRRWLRKDPADVALADIEGGISDEPESGNGRADRARRALAWRGLERSKLVLDADQVQPGDTLVLPVEAGGWDDFGHIPGAARDEPREGPWPDRRVDRAEEARPASRGDAVLRLHPAVMQGWPEAPALAAIREILGSSDPASQPSDLKGHLADYADELAKMPEAQAWQWLTELAAQLARHKVRIAAYPSAAGDGEAQPPGIVLQAPRLEEGGSDELSAAGPVPLAKHLSAVQEIVADTARRLLPDDLTGALEEAARLHDVGKADPRFQALLLGGDPLAARFAPVLLAKGMPATTRAERQRQRVRSGLPEGFRHETLSVQIAERFGLLDGSRADEELILHVIASHHGFCRPLAPVVLDLDPPAIEIPPPVLGRPIQVSPEARKRWTPPERLDSRIAERFWRVVRRFGWWGAAYLEAIFRLADWQASQQAAKEDPEDRSRPTLEPKEPRNA